VTRHVGFVYFLKSPATGLYKIGYSEDLPQRIGDLSRAQGVELELLFCIEGDRSDETRLLRRFQSCRQLGEWFAGDEVPAFVATVQRLAPWEARAVVAGAHRTELTEPKAERARVTPRPRPPVIPLQPVREISEEAIRWHQELRTRMVDACRDVIKRIGIVECAAQLDEERAANWPNWPAITTMTLAGVFIQGKHNIRMHWMPWFAERSGAVRDIVYVSVMRDIDVAREYLDLASEMRRELGDDEAERLLREAAA
jgi:hypothetical protein